MKIRVALDASKLPVVMPRIGLQLNILNDLQYVLYKGNGPHECYPDRKASSIHALHHAHVDDMYTPYVHPTESSGRTDVHWCSFTQTDTNNISSTENNRVGTSSSSSSRRDATSVFMDTTDGDAAPVKKTIGLLVYSGYITGNRDVTNVLSNNSTTVAASASSTSLPRNHYTTKASINSDYDSIVKAARDSDSREQVKLFNFSAQRHTTEDLALATHSSELELFPRQFVAVNVDPFMMGV